VKKNEAAVEYWDWVTHWTPTQCHSHEPRHYHLSF